MFLTKTNSSLSHTKQFLAHQFERTRTHLAHWRTVRFVPISAHRRHDFCRGHTAHPVGCSGCSVGGTHTSGRHADDYGRTRVPGDGTGATVEANQRQHQHKDAHRTGACACVLSSACLLISVSVRWTLYVTMGLELSGCLYVCSGSLCDECMLVRRCVVTHAPIDADTCTRPFVLQMYIILCAHMLVSTQFATREAQERRLVHVREGKTNASAEFQSLLAAPPSIIVSR